MNISDIDEDEVHFTSGSSFLEFHHLKSFEKGDIIYSFRTLQNAAVLFYWKDDYNNFLQVELRQADVIVVVYNSMDAIYDMNITVAGEI